MASNTPSAKDNLSFDRDVELAAYETLDPELRKALREASNKYAALEVMALINTHGRAAVLSVLREEREAQHEPGGTSYRPLGEPRRRPRGAL